MDDLAAAPAGPGGWAMLVETSPVGQAGFAVIVLTCLAMALRGLGPGAALAGLLSPRRPPR